MSENYEALTPYIDVTNEFSHILVRKVSTKNGVRLEIFSPATGTRVFLDPLQLEYLTMVDIKTFEKIIDLISGGPPEEDKNVN
ncbi:MULTISPECIES: dihydrodiol dehydrogenase [Sulfolobaceae]|uniref:Dihydrodiol dehydrogenase n=1 Tax=Metallosphaera prunae TaxID=47304 RepID=A0A4D8RPS6_METPR|nr:MULTISPECIES: dihydrodiol dehydrogenase [Sulfolobaceae]MCY0851100.1 hypothetical protein [Sulfuracidifex metallicus]QCO29121.1 dihydrodiol dehydrogenase [Metallosphaera prunae]BBL47296.1 hypothetical protein MJ1HA_1397 [Metallosphaera sedula]